MQDVTIEMYILSSVAFVKPWEDVLGRHNNV